MVTIRPLPSGENGYWKCGTLRMVTIRPLPSGENGYWKCGTLAHDNSIYGIRKTNCIFLLLFSEFKLIRRNKGNSIENFILTTRASARLLLPQCYYIVVIIVAGNKMHERDMNYTGE